MDTAKAGTHPSDAELRGEGAIGRALRYSLWALLAGAVIGIGFWWAGQDTPVLTPVQDFKSRHGSVLLSFDAVEKALKEMRA